MAGTLMNDTANWYPTHSIGPVAQWIEDRSATLSALSAPAARIAGVIPYSGDANIALIQTEKGKLIEIRLDIVSARPTVSTTHYLLQGTKGVYRDAEGQKSIWLEGVHKENAWGDWAPYEDQYEDPRWNAEAGKAKASGHGGADWFTLRAFFKAVALKQPSPIDVYSSVEWSSIIALTTASVKEKGRPQDFPKFRRLNRTQA